MSDTSAPGCEEIREMRRRENGIDLCLDPRCERCWKGDAAVLRQHIEDNRTVDPLAYLTAIIAGIM